MGGGGSKRYICTTIKFSEQLPPCLTLMTPKWNHGSKLIMTVLFIFKASRVIYTIIII